MSQTKLKTEEKADESQTKDKTEEKAQESRSKHKSEDEAREEVWKSAFDIFDKDKDGLISLDELGIILRSVNFNPTQKEIEEAKRKLDKDGNGRCDFEDFKILLREMETSQECFKEDMLRAFAIFDQNRNDVIERKEIRYVLCNLGETLTEQELDYMMKYADLNGDGHIDYGEFVKLCLKPCF